MIIFMEGLPGAGKSTNSGFLYRQFERNDYKTRWIHELARPHPVLFFHEAWLKSSEYRDWKERYDLGDTPLDRIVQFRETSVGIDLLELSWNHQGLIPDPAASELKKKDVWNFTLEEYMEAALLITRAVRMVWKLILNFCRIIISWRRRFATEPHVLSWFWRLRKKSGRLMKIRCWTFSVYRSFRIQACGWIADHFSTAL